MPLRRVTFVTKCGCGKEINLTLENKLGGGVKGYCHDNHFEAMIATAKKYGLARCVHEDQGKAAAEAEIAAQEPPDPAESEVDLAMDAALAEMSAKGEEECERAADEAMAQQQAEGQAAEVQGEPQ
jgi:hypothetical protein